MEKDGVSNSSLLCPADVFTRVQIDLRLAGNMPISFFGILTNLLNIWVFLDPDMRISLVNHFLLALSVVDLALLVANFFFLIFPVIAWLSRSGALHHAYPLILWYSYPLALSAQTAGVYLTVLVSVHRYLGVCQPFRARLLVSARAVRAAIAGCLVFAILVNVTVWFELSVQPCWIIVKNDIRTVALSSLRQSPVYSLLAKAVLYTVVMFIAPFAILILVNSAIIGALRKSSRLRAMHSSRRRPPPPEIGPPPNMLQHFRLLRNAKYSDILQSINMINQHKAASSVKSSSSTGTSTSGKDRGVTLMLLAIVAIFLLCNSPAFVNNVLEICFIYIHGDSDMAQSTAFERSVEVGNILVSLNSSSSIFVYLVFSSKYRTIVESWLGLTTRRKLNLVAVTTAVAAQKALELSMLPDEVERRTEDERRRRRARTRLLERTASQSELLVGPHDGRRRRSRTAATLPPPASSPDGLVRPAAQEDEDHPVYLTTVVNQTKLHALLLLRGRRHPSAVTVNGADHFQHSNHSNQPPQHHSLVLEQDPRRRLLRFDTIV